ncbi:ATP-binding protein [Carboxylicivirga sp. N1Y90]|uniref:sensor histidine kinase n=1 Tax=Carboxylicivirga fragile TaxID=3417571 RepID=UPI003D325440|nr:transporter substrate-binding domain-containing protein [Marinilabiliaceae bacterium N1Y90]
MSKVLCTLLLLFVALSMTKSQDTVRVGAFNLYPGIFLDTDGVVKGFYVDALNSLGEKENIEFVYVYGSWDDGLARMKSGEVDMLTSVAITQDRLNYMDYTSTPLLTVWSEVYVDQDSEIRGILGLEGKTIAIMKSDFNGGFLKQLTTKFDVSCTFVETADFEEVFKLVSKGQVDAGVVNNTFGAPKSVQYGLLTSGIVFNPFDIFFTVKKGANESLLNLLNQYLNDWKHDRNSVYNLALQKWSHDNVGAIEVLPQWLKDAIYFVVLLVLVLLVFVALLRYRVKVAVRKVKYSERLFKTFMENTPAYVYIKDHNLQHIYRNRMVDRVNTASPEDKNSSAKTIFEAHVARMVEKTDRQIINSELNQTNIQYQCKLNGKDTWLHDYKFQLDLPDNDLAVGGVSFDITQLKETEFELIKAKEKAEESDRLKSSFLANMSHEIRTPMNGILGFSELLKDPGLNNEEKEQYIDVIEKSGARMLNIINDIIDISKIESGQMIVNKTDLNINILLDDLNSFFNEEASRKKIKLTLHKALADSEVNLHCDGDMFYAVLSNLLKNALKYTFEGRIEFGYTLNASQEELQFYVNDTGIGVAPEKQKLIFERFIQADIEDKMALQGAGLGLAISKAYVEMLGGKIWVESELGKQSTFFFTLPYKTSGLQ